MEERLENLKTGTKLTSQGRTISEGDFTAMVNLSWETGPIHSDQEYAKTTNFGERVLGGPCIIPLVGGLSNHPLHMAWDRAGLGVVALLSIENVHFTAPLHPGDTIWVETEVSGLRPASKANRYIMNLKDVVYKQDGRAILDMERVVLLQKEN